MKLIIVIALLVIPLTVHANTDWSVAMVESTMKRMGIDDPMKLAGLVEKGSVAATRITEYAALAAKLGKDVDVAKVVRNIAKEATQRDLSELDGIVRLAIERYGPLQTLQMAGGWKKLASRAPMSVVCNGRVH